MRKCLVETCQEISRAKGYCKAHYQQIKRTGIIKPFNKYRTEKIKEKCSAPECNRISEIKGHCKAHYNQILKHGHITSDTIRPLIYNGKCIIEGCDNKSRAMRYCKMHYNRIARTGSACSSSSVSAARCYTHEGCSVFNCRNKHKAKGYCRRHYIAFKKYGDPLMVKDRKLSFHKKSIINFDPNKITNTYDFDKYTDRHDDI